ncbi:MAG: energy-coupling factor transporter ATPase, partial [Erysipelotrichaceae bacterium]|nr:energy-coupling factor transporter ATPase [Erysipelotrichaceae bacterium]
MPIKFEKVSHIYSDGSPFTYTALKNIDLEISEGKLTAIIGATGSGKSTLVQHLNALLLPSDGKVYILDRTIASDEKPTKLKSLRKDVGLVFQFPEYQLFEETIIKDVAFGPKNFDCSEEEALIKAKKALAMVNIDASFYDKSPLDLSGGQKRRVAIAGILAMDPKIIVLDEPTAGLDPQGAKAMMELFQRLNKQYQKTIIIVSHDMEHVFNYCDEVVVLDHGNVRCHLTVDEFFKDTKW